VRLLVQQSVDGREQLFLSRVDGRVAASHVMALGAV
jgi:hypothetical protein